MLRLEILFRPLLVALILLASGSLMTPAYGYSLLTHEQLIDLTWQDSIAPLLRSRYPGLSAEDLDRARAYAYGGCVIQDIGYYPFGDPFLSELTHYVRSGDFIVNLFRGARNANELAFAIGALSHYIGDTVGHAQATNLAVPVVFPKLAAKYGPVVTYAEDEHAHVRTEFAFDINEIAHHRFAPVHYLRHVGLGVPTAQLAAAYYQTYGIGGNFSQRRSRRINVRGYRFAVHGFLPRIAYAVTLLNRKKMPADSSSEDTQKLERELARVASENDWDKYRKKPGIGTYSLAGLLYILPKFGTLKLVAVKGPTVATEEEYVRSVNRSADALRAAMQRLREPRHSAEERYLENRDLDTGTVVRPGSYKLTDETYAVLLHRLATDPHATLPSRVKSNVLDYYSDLSAPFETKRDAVKWARVQADLKVMSTMRVSEQPIFEGLGDAAADIAPKPE